MYFSIVTMATVGFGDITPLSPLGKLVTVMMILSGIILIPWQIGKLIKAVILTHTKVQTICSKCGLTHHDLKAIHCNRCGKKLKKKKKKLEEQVE